MNLTRLQLTNLRAFQQAEFEFTPGMNLLVGINGVGKTTVLDALRVCVSRILPQITASRSRPIGLADEDLRIDAPATTLQLDFSLSNSPFHFLLHKQRERVTEQNAGEVRKQTFDTPDQEAVTPPLSKLGKTMKTRKTQPLCVFFSIRRSLPSDITPSSFTAFGGQAGAFTDALSSRELRLTEIALWMRAQAAIADEEPLAGKHLAAVHRAAKVFLPQCRNLRVETEPKLRLVIEKYRKSLDVRQLSDGERSSLALVLDLARRLSQANPGLTDPLRSGQAIVLIDELDLHLHPKWQRTIVDRLTKTFPHCQFIATTHSPQIVAAVEPEQVILLTDVAVERAQRTLGMDSNWILHYLMETDERPEGASKAIRQVEDMIDKGTFRKARAAIARGKKKGWDFPEWSVLEARMARFEVLSK
jgi:predicted ATP-binding protein involved in virulence